MELIVIAGRVGQDAKIIDTNGVRKIQFSVAVDKSYKDSQGNRIERTNWWTIFSNRENLAQYIKKGQFLTISGSPNFSIYRDTQTGNESINLSMNNPSISFGPRPDNGSNQPQQRPQQAQPASTSSQPHQSTNMAQNEVIDMTANQEEDDLPF